MDTICQTMKPTCVDQTLMKLIPLFTAARSVCVCVCVCLSVLLQWSETAEPLERKLSLKKANPENQTQTDQRFFSAQGHSD